MKTLVTNKVLKRPLVLLNMLCLLQAWLAAIVVVP